VAAIGDGRKTSSAHLFFCARRDLSQRWNNTAWKTPCAERLDAQRKEGEVVFFPDEQGI